MLSSASQAEIVDCHKAEEPKTVIKWRTKTVEKPVTRTVYKDRIVYKDRFVTASRKKNHISLLAGTGYFEEDYHVEWFPHQEDREPIVTNYYSPVGGLMYQRFVTSDISMSFVAFTNMTLGAGVGFGW